MPTQTRLEQLITLGEDHRCARLHYRSRLTPTQLFDRVVEPYNLTQGKEDVLLRAADVVLKEKKKLILVPRETPLNLVHVRNFELLLLAGATILPANPSFYTRPETIEQVVDTVVARVLDHLGLPQRLVARWAEEGE